MATADLARPARARRRRWLIAGALVLAGLLVWFWRPLNSFAATGASYGAHIGCSCRHIGGRALGDCRKDFESGMALVILSEDPKARTVTARMPPLASATARFVPGEGCLLDPWED